MWTITNAFLKFWFNQCLKLGYCQWRKTSLNLRLKKIAKNVKASVDWGGIAPPPVGIFLRHKRKKGGEAQWLLLVTMRGDRRNNGEIPPYWFLLYPCIACIHQIQACIACINCIHSLYCPTFHSNILTIWVRSASHYYQLLLKPLSEVIWLSSTSSLKAFLMLVGWLIFVILSNIKQLNI